MCNINGRGFTNSFTITSELVNPLPLMFYTDLHRYIDRCEMYRAYRSKNKVEKYVCRGVRTKCTKQQEKVSSQWAWPQDAMKVATVRTNCTAGVERTIVTY